MAALHDCIVRCRTLRQLQEVHAQFVVSSAPPHPLADLLSAVAATSGTSSSLNYAAALFRHLSAPPSTFAYNAIIRVHSAAASPNLHSVSYYSHMLATGIRPDHFTFPFLFKHCSHRLDSIVGGSLHGHVFKFGFHADIYVNNAIIFMYSSCRLMDLAGKVFDEIHARDVVSWNSMLACYLRCGELDMALDLFRGMEGRNVITWNSIISGLVQGGRPRAALSLFHEMLLFGGGEFAKPDKVTIASVISACSYLGALDQGQWIHGYLKRQRLELDVVTATSLIDMYGKCGSVRKAIHVFEDMPKRDVFAWTAMISVYATHGLAEEAFDLLEEMERNGVRPNHVTFGALLSACAHSGLVEKGRWCFDRMKSVYLIEPQPQHYACMVDLLGRVGMFEEAGQLIRRMPMHPDTYVWGALLGACRMHGNVEIGERVASHLIRLHPLDHANYVTLSDIYAKVNRFKDVKRVRSFMFESGIKKTAPGCSMIEVDGQVLEFSAKRALKDLTHDIEWMLHVINDELKYKLSHSDEEIVLTFRY